MYYEIAKNYRYVLGLLIIKLWLNKFNTFIIMSIIRFIQGFDSKKDFKYVKRIRLLIIRYQVVIISKKYTKFKIIRILLIQNSIYKD